MSDFTITLEKNGNTHKVNIKNGQMTVVNKIEEKTARKGCMFRVEDGKLHIEDDILQHPSFSIRVAWEKVKDIGIDGAKAYSIVDADFRERVGLSKEKTLYDIDGSSVSFHIETEKQVNDEVYYLVVNAKPEMRGDL